MFIRSEINGADGPGTRIFFPTSRTSLSVIFSKGLTMAGRPSTQVPIAPQLISSIIGSINTKFYVLRVTYTMYDMRRDQDSLNPRTHANIMVLSPETDPSAHPYWYAHKVGIFHTLVCHESSPGPIRLDLLWVRWYGLDPDRHWQLS